MRPKDGSPTQTLFGGSHFRVYASNISLRALLLLCPKLCGRHAGRGSEGAGEGTVVVEAAGVSDLRYRLILLTEHPRC